MAGKLTLTTAQINDSATATNNFVLKADNAGGVKLSRGNDGATTQDILSVDASGNVNANVAMQQGGIAMPRMVLATAQNTTSGTAIDFTGIPSWVKRITILCNAISTNGTNPYLVQLGSGAIASSGYDSVSNAASSGGNGLTSSTAGFVVFVNSAAYAITGLITLVNLSGNSWICSHTVSTSAGTNATYSGGGRVTLSGTIDRLRLTTVGGTDTFDAGSVNILYEG